MQPSASEDEKTYKDLFFKMKIAVGFAIPVFAIAIIEMMSNNPLMQIMPIVYWNWMQLLLSLPVVFCAC